MAVFRIEKNKNYTVMANYHLRDISLSLKAKGLLSLMLSLPEGWDYTTKGLACICKDGVDSICSTVKELEKAGYVQRRRLRNELGHLTEIEYTILEKPVRTASPKEPALPDSSAKAGTPPKREKPVLDYPVLDIPEQAFPEQAIPEQEEPEQDNPAQLNIQESITEKSRIRHELKRTYDYIQTPKKSGYRSLHLVYRFKSDTPDKEIYNQYPMLIELQFRTHLQHIWATALETIGLFTNQALKAGQGSEEILRFFVVVSSLFAIREECPIAPGTVNDEKELISEIEILNDQHHILDMLKAIRTVIDNDADKVPDKKGYYILQLNYETHMLTRWFFKPSELDKANAMYDALEKKRDGAPLDIVMVRAASYSTVKDAYPNYFMDIGEFVDLISEYLK